MDLRLTVENQYCQLRNLSLFFLFQVGLLALVYYTSGTYLFFGGIQYAPVLIVGTAVVSTGVAYYLTANEYITPEESEENRR